MRMGILVSETVQKQIRINAAYYELVPRSNIEDRAKLKKSIIKNGVQIPIILNRDGFILDGHTRYEICLELGITDIPTKTKSFPDETAERKFVVMTNLARRHLNRFQKAELSWPLFEIEQKRAKERADWRKNQPELAVTNKKGKLVKIKKKIKEGNAVSLYGKKVGLGNTIISQVYYLKKFASKESLDKCRNNELSVNRAYFLLRGQRLMPSGVKPEKAINFCPQCNSKSTSPKKTKCHVHRWFCCEHCRWGI